jgi:hypothetical protein
MRSKRVTFTFDERNFERMRRIKELGQFSSFADAVRDSLTVNSALQNQASEGFTEVIVRNPKTGDERILVR